MRLKSILPVLAFVGVLSVASCAHVGPIASCATDLVVQVIQSDLGGPDWSSKIETDVLKYGVGVIDCVVNAIIAQAEHRAGAGGEPVVQHAKAYRAKRAGHAGGSVSLNDSGTCTVKNGSVSLKSPGDDQVPTPPVGARRS